MFKAFALHVVCVQVVSALLLVSLQVQARAQTQAQSQEPHKSLFVIERQLVTVKRVLNVRRPGMVSPPEDHQLIRKLHSVVQRDVRAQVFYD